MVNLNIRIDENLKTDAEAILNNLGLTVSDAVRLFFAQIRNTRSIPFELKLYDEPNTELKSAMKRVDDYVNGKNKSKFITHHDIDGLIADVENEEL